MPFTCACVPTRSLEHVYDSQRNPFNSSDVPGHQTLFSSGPTAVPLQLGKSGWSQVKRLDINIFACTVRFTKAVLFMNRTELFFFLMIRPPPRSSLFPYTSLFC